MKQLTTSILFLVLGLQLQAQNISEHFSTTSSYPNTYLIYNQELDFDYCLDGTIYFFHPTTHTILEERSISGGSLSGYAIPVKKVSPDLKTISFVIHLTDCSDAIDKVWNNTGYYDNPTTSNRSLDGSLGITVELDKNSQQLHNHLEAEKVKKEKKKVDTELELIANEKRTIKVGDLLYICNGGGPCEVIAREVTPTKIKVEFISQCYPENRGGNISRWTHISQGHQRWLEKKYIYGTEKVKCYGKQSAIR